MILGITGGVGSGKSTVLTYLSTQYNAQIIEADYVAKCIMEPGHNAYDRVIKAFPNIELDSEGNIDRTSFAKIVFGCKDKLVLLNGIVHPEVKKEIISMIDETMKVTPNRMIVIEAALLIEDGYKDICDEIWFVYCELETRINRLMVNRGYTREKALSIINNQMSDEDFKASTDEFIDNSNSNIDCTKAIDELIKEKLN